MNSKEYYDDRFSCYKSGSTYYISLGIHPDIMQVKSSLYKGLVFFESFVKQTVDIYKVAEYWHLFYMSSCAEDIIFYYLYPGFNVFYTMNQLDFNSVIGLANIDCELSIGFNNRIKVDIDKEMVKFWFLKNKMINTTLDVYAKYCVKDIIDYFYNVLDKMKFSKKQVTDAKEHYMKTVFTTEYKDDVNQVGIYADKNYLYYVKDDMLYCKIQKNSKKCYKVAVYLYCLYNATCFTDNYIELSDKVFIKNFMEL